jgi:outer membrane protein, multidrug efflux system
MRSKLTAVALVTTLWLAGCASVLPDGGMSSAVELARPGLSSLGLPAESATASPSEDRDGAVKALLEGKPLTMDNAVRLALLNSPRIAQSLAQLRVSDAERVQAATLPNPHLAIARAVEGDKLMREWAMGLNLFGVLALPWRAEWAGQQAEMAKLAAAQEILRVAAEARKAWITAVSAKQTAIYARDSKVAAEAAGELARRMASVGNWSKLNQARVQVALADAAAAQARAENAAVAERERLIRVLGLWGTQTQFELPDRLPDLPRAVRDSTDIEAQALRQRLDVRAARMQSDAVSKSLGFTQVTGFVNALDLKLVRESTLDRATGELERKRMWEVELPIPIFDWGSAANARAEATYMQSVAALQQVAVAARSEAREAYHSYRTAHDVAVHYRDEIVPLRKFIQNETLLRYNGMLIGVFELITDARLNMAAVNASLDALRDFWLIETDLHLALTGTSPGGISALKPATGAAAAEEKGH